MNLGVAWALLNLQSGLGARVALGMFLTPAPSFPASCLLKTTGWDPWQSWLASRRSGGLPARPVESASSVRSPGPFLRGVILWNPGWKRTRVCALNTHEFVPSDSDQHGAFTPAPVECSLCGESWHPRSAVCWHVRATVGYTSRGCPFAPREEQACRPERDTYVQ